MILNLKVLNRQIGFKLICRKNGFEEVVGYTNRCKDGLYIVTLDYDDMPYEFVEQEVKRLQEDYGLSDFYIIQSSDTGYHAVCLDKVVFHYYLDILINSSVDRGYLNIPISSGKKLWVLRATSKNGIKPVLLKHLKHNSCIGSEKSLAHLKLLSRILDVKMPKDLEDYDESKDIILARYKA